MVLSLPTARNQCLCSLVRRQSVTGILCRISTISTSAALRARQTLPAPVNPGSSDAAANTAVQQVLSRYPSSTPIAKTLKLPYPRPLPLGCCLASLSSQGTAIETATATAKTTITSTSTSTTRSRKARESGSISGRAARTERGKRRSFHTSSTAAATRKMASDEDYMAFLDKANRDPSEGYNNAKSSQTASASGGPFKTTSEGVEVPPPLVKVTRDAFYTSDADEPFEAVALRWDEDGKGLPDEGMLYFLLASSNTLWPYHLHSRPCLSTRLPPHLQCRDMDVVVPW